jgi:serine/threonine-protein kinase
MTTAPFLQRHLGDYLLVAQLGEDALGTVFRALYVADERRFVRLRILQSEELPPALIERAIRTGAGEADPPPHDALVSRPQLDLVDGIPFLTWDETAGWTLDAMLARVRAFGIRIPAEYALLIAERLAAALEHAHQSAPKGHGVHGLLWPGFVSISHDAAVRVGGFAMAPAVLPLLQRPRMAAEIAPYVAPEVRAGGAAGPGADVYALGAILEELLTGRRPSLDASAAQLRAGDPRSEELGAFLRRCLAAPGERFASAVEAHRALQQLLTGNPFSLYTANLSLFLYKLLNPESQSVAPSSDWESTNPVVTEAPLPREAAQRSPAPLPQEPPPPAPIEAPPAVQEHAAELPVGRRDSRARELMARAWSRPAAALAAAASVAVGAFLVASRIQSIRGAASLAPTAREMASAPAPAPAFPMLSLPDSAPPAAGAGAPAPAGRLAATSNRPRPARKIKTELRQPTEELRLRAALARIEADRLNARETAGELFGEGRESEQEGERLLRQRDYDAAQMAFSRAARLFQRAQELTWEERLRLSDLSAAR